MAPVMSNPPNTMASLLKNPPKGITFAAPYVDQGSDPLGTTGPSTKKQIVSNPTDTTSKGYCPILPGSPVGEVPPGKSNVPKRTQDIMSNGGPTGTGSKLATIAKSIGMDSQCQTAASTHASSFMDDTKAAGVVLFGGFAAATTNAGMDMDNKMQQIGCGNFSMTANTLLNETNNITCNVNQTYTSTSVTVDNDTNVSITQHLPNKAVVAEINDAIARMDATIAKLTMLSNKVHLDPVPAAWQDDWGRPPIAAIALAKIKSITASITELSAARLSYIKENPVTGGVSGTKLDVIIKDSISINNKQSVSTSSTAQLTSSIINAAGAVAFNKLSQTAGVNSLSPESKSYLQQQIKDEVNKQTNNISSRITNNKFNVATDKTVTLVVVGPIVKSDIEINLGSQSNLSVNQVIKSAVNIGQHVAAQINASIHSASNTDTKVAGLADMINKMEQGLVDQIRTADKGQDSFFKSFFSFLGNIWLMIAAIGIAVLMFFPKLTEMFPPYIRYVLMGILAYIIVAWFISWWPFNKSQKRHVPVSVPVVPPVGGSSNPYSRFASHANNEERNALKALSTTSEGLSKTFKTTQNSNTTSTAGVSPTAALADAYLAKIRRRR